MSCRAESSKAPVEENVMLKVHRLGYANLVTPDLEKQVDYWTRVIGLQIVDRSPDQVFLATKLGLEAIVLERGAASHLSRISFQLRPTVTLVSLQQHCIVKA